MNIIPAIESIYRWQGKVETAAEVLAIFKTSAAAFADFEQILTELHPYEVPEIIALAPEKIAEPYRRWVCAESILRSRSDHAD